MFFQRKNSKKVKDPEGSKKKGKDGRGKNDLFDRAKGGLDALAGSFRSAKNDAETSTEKLQGDVKSGIETILHKGSDLLEKAKEELGSHSSASSSKELDKEPESEEKAEEGEAAQSVDEGASADKTEEPNVLEQAVEEIQAVDAALQQTAPAAETETEIPVETAAAAETAAAETSAEGDKPEETNREEEKDDPKKRLDFAGFFAMLFEMFCSPGNKKKD